jgi:uncharacterized membrane protein YbhN (UPF0104 family)
MRGVMAILKEMLSFGGRYKVYLRVLVSMAILAVILRSVDTFQVLDILKGAKPDLLWAALILQLGSATLSAFRWQFIMRNLGFGLMSPFYLRSYFKAMFFNQGLPTSVGGDAIRVLDVANRGYRKRDALYGVLLDRVVGLGALLVMNLVAYPFAPDMLPDSIYALTLLAVACGMACLAVVSSARFLQWLDAYPRLAILGAVAQRLRLAFLSNRLLIGASSLLIPLLAMLSFHATGSALGLQYGFVTYLVIVPPAIILTIIPISLAGWGVREGALVALFALIGADRAVILTMSILYGLMQVIVSLPGFIIFLAGRKHKS